jgi:hypothetical protein
MGTVATLIARICSYLLMCNGVPLAQLLAKLCAQHLEKATPISNQEVKQL